MAKIDLSAFSFRHGHARRGKKSSEYNSWRGMIERCYRPNHIGYKYYGGRGITVFHPWRTSFNAFLADMGLKPSPAYTIERIDPDGDYEPSNCRWATQAEQRANQRHYDEAARARKGWESGKRSRISPFRINLIGQKFERLTVIGGAESVAGRAMWECRCSCGNIAKISGKSLRQRTTRSCGCLSREINSALATERNRKRRA